MAHFATIVVNAGVAIAAILQSAMAARVLTKEDNHAASFQKNPVGAKQVIAFFPDAHCLEARMFEVAVTQTDCYQLAGFLYDNKDLYFAVGIDQKKVSFKFGSNIVCGASVYQRMTTSDKEFSIEGSIVGSSSTCLTVEGLGLDFKGVRLSPPLEEIYAQKAAREKAKPCNEFWKSVEELLRDGWTVNRITWNDMEKKILPVMFGGSRHLNDWPINQDFFNERAGTTTDSQELKNWSQERFCEWIEQMGGFAKNK
mmetsp:Transcript_84642/g.163228  ORF Transcript_84642/g.163228 Transcript_84642/m.163228 type:complete len:255 (+) Transcript_84642:64-828(+)